MFKRLLYPLQAILVLVCSAVLLADAPPKASSPVTFEYPARQMPTQEPPLRADAPIVINENEWFVFEQKMEGKDGETAVIIDSPQGIVSVEAHDNRLMADQVKMKTAIPFRMRGWFAGGNGKVETKEFKSPLLWIIEPLKTGSCELLVYWPSKPREVFRYSIQANRGPQPPPKPPGPTPTPAPIPVSGFRVLLIEETAQNMTEDQTQALNSPAVREYLNRKTVKNSDGSAGWRRFDKDVILTDKTPEVFRQMWADTKPKLGKLPQVLIVNDRAGQLHEITNEAELLKLLKAAGGE